MSTMELDPAQLFDGFPEPVLLLEEGTVRYRNPAAGRVLPGLREGDRAPEELAVPADAEFPIVCTGRVGARSFRMSVQGVGREGLLAVLRPEHEAAAGPGLEKLALRLRQETAGLAASLQRLEPAGGESDQKKREKYLAAANQGLYRLLRLADHLEFADARDQDLYRPAPLDMAGFCRELFREVESVCAMSGYRFSYETELVTLLTVGDEALLRRLVLSLVSNAMKAAGAGGALGARLAKRRGRAVLTVWDRGKGLEAEDLARLFGGEARGVSMDPGEGLGLGLEAVRRIARLHGGFLMMEGRPEEGLRAVVSLPVQPPEAGVGLRSPAGEYAGGFSPVLVELSDVLSARVFAPEDVN